MRAGSRARLAMFIGTFMALSCPLLIVPAHASTWGETPVTHQQPVARHVAPHKTARFASASALQCVPFARANSGIAIKGNAVNWWDAAAGVYERGSRPEAGAVLNFRATGQMRLGHVAVVTNVLSSREVEIDHANWTRFGATRGNISRAMHVVDVSANNDWSAVRVELGHTGDFGAVYPTYGFIYDRPDSGAMVANTLTELHPTGERPALAADEVAEAPMPRVITPSSLPVDAPDHSLR